MSDKVTDNELLEVARAVGVVRRRPRLALTLLAWQVATPAEIDEHLAELADDERGKRR